VNSIFPVSTSSAISAIRIVVEPNYRFRMLALEALLRYRQVAGGNGRQAADSKDFLTQPPVLPQRIERA
jgi:hypothetical protein